jgi:hypothetical protein
LVTRVTVAAADLVMSAAEVAVTITVGGFGALEGAAYRPVESTVPQLLPEHPAPLTDHVTAVFEVPVTVTWNCWVPPTGTVAVVGDTTTVTGISVTMADAERLGSATEVAFTVAVDWVATTAGAVYSPALLNDPCPLNDQVTRFSAWCVIVAANCCVCPPPNVVAVGAMEIESGVRVTVAEADLVGSATDVAHTVAVVALGITYGAAYSPALLTEPAPDPETDQVTAVFVWWFTVAVNCRLCPPSSAALAGEMATEIGVRVSVQESDFVGSATDVAVIVTVAWVGIRAGPVKIPVLLSNVPHAAPVHPVALILQVKAVLVWCVTAAESV